MTLRILPMERSISRTIRLDPWPLTPVMKNMNWMVRLHGPVRVMESGLERNLYVDVSAWTISLSTVGTLNVGPP